MARKESITSMYAECFLCDHWLCLTYQITTLRTLVETGGKPVKWQDIGLQLGRTAKVCMNAYYRERKVKFLYLGTVVTNIIVSNVLVNIIQSLSCTDGPYAQTCKTGEVVERRGKSNPIVRSMTIHVQHSVFRRSQPCGSLWKLNKKNFETNRPIGMQRGQQPCGRKLACSWVAQQ